MDIEKLKLEAQNKALHIADVSNSFICDSCEKQTDISLLVMLTDEWYVCQDCFEKESVGDCEYSSFCNYIGNCDESC